MTYIGNWSSLRNNWGYRLPEDYEPQSNTPPNGTQPTSQPSVQINLGQSGSAPTTYAPPPYTFQTSSTGQSNPALQSLLSEMPLPDLYMLVPDLVVYPPGYWANEQAGLISNTPQNQNTIEMLDLVAFEISTAKAVGISFTDYRTLLGEIRTKESMWSSTEDYNANGGYGGAFGGDDEYGSIMTSRGFTNGSSGDDRGYYHTSSANEAYAANALISLYSGQFQSPQAARDAILAGGFYRTVQAGGTVTSQGETTTTMGPRLQWVAFGGMQAANVFSEGFFGSSSTSNAGSIGFGGQADAPDSTRIISLSTQLQQKDPLEIAKTLAEMLRTASARNAAGFGQEAGGMIFRGNNGRLYMSNIFKGPIVGPGQTGSVTLDPRAIINGNQSLGLEIVASWHTHTRADANASSTDNSSRNTWFAAFPTYLGEVIAAKGDVTQIFSRPPTE
jgi:hypothetical protein